MNVCMFVSTLMLLWEHATCLRVRSLWYEYAMLRNNPGNARVCPGLQAPMLGPILFSIYTNDMPSTISTSDINMYADDTALYTSDNNAVVAAEKISNDLSGIQEWCIDSLSTKARLMPCFWQTIWYSLSSSQVRTWMENPLWQEKTPPSNYHLQDREQDCPKIPP